MLKRIDWWRVATLVCLTVATVLLPVSLVAGHANGLGTVGAVALVVTLWALVLDGAR